MASTTTNIHNGVMTITLPKGYKIICTTAVEQPAKLQAPNADGKIGV